MDLNKKAEELREQGLTPDEIKIWITAEQNELIIKHIGFLLLNLEEFHPNSIILKSNHYRYLKKVCEV